MRLAAESIRRSSWRLRSLHCTAAVLAIASALPAQEGGPTLDEVRTAVDDYFADDQAAVNASRASLQRWGDAAVPRLRSLAGEPSGLPRVMPLEVFSMLGDHRLVCAIDQIGTDSAIALLLDIADGRTGVDPSGGFRQLAMGSGYKYKERLKDDSRFKTIVLRATLERDGPLAEFQRAEAADAIAELGWTDAAEVVEAMIRDPSPRVAERAARALFELTGRRVEVPRPPPGFPARLERKPPLSSPVEAPKSRRMRARFGFWRDGRAGLLVADDQTLSLVGPDGETQATWESPGAITDVLSFRLPSGEGRWVVATTTQEYTSSVSGVAASDWEGRPLWSFDPRSAGSVSMAVLHDAAGPCGVAIGPERRDATVAFGDAGQPLFTTWAALGQSLRTHPRLPGRLLAYGGDTQLLDSEGRPTVASRMTLGLRPRGPWFYSEEAALFPDAEGRPAIVASGSRMPMAPVIVRLDHELAEVWAATVPGDIRGLVMLEPDGGPRLFAAACETGELFVFDEDGAAFETIRLVDGLDPGETMFVYGMDAGPFEDGSWGLAIALVDRTL
ncbi:MAG TPA: hypothetical protein VFD43_06390, partial [Planctomycetota bacterium]|nr:hypothetical protein [Planctomycetota bacterium]